LQKVIYLFFLIIHFEFYLGDGEGNAWYDEEDEDQQWLSNKQKEKVKLANQNEKNIKQDKTKMKKTTMVKFNEEIQTKTIDEDDSMEDEGDFDDEDDDQEKEAEDDMEEIPVIKEDIYGRTIDATGSVVKNNSSKIEE
jgi:hypothetical protein